MGRSAENHVAVRFPRMGTAGLLKMIRVLAADLVRHRDKSRG